MKEIKQPSGNTGNEYKPAPEDTDSIALPETLIPLMEKIAENVHEVWAKSRMDEGWKYGESRNDTLKTHPCLVPYSRLPEIEKEYDRKTASGTLKLVLKLGYKIIPEK